MKIILSISLFLMAFISRADAWDNLTEDQAHQVVRFLHKNPFIFDFCDCCGESVEVYLLKVESAEIIPCSWDKKQFSVLTKSRRIARMQWTSIGLDDYHTDEVNEEVEYTIFMNYTFAFDKHMKWAVPFHKLIKYSLNGPICIGATNYPNPKDSGVKITDKDYMEWFQHHFDVPEEK